MWKKMIEHFSILESSFLIKALKRAGNLDLLAPLPRCPKACDWLIWTKTLGPLLLPLVCTWCLIPEENLTDYWSLLWTCFCLSFLVTLGRFFLPDVWIPIETFLRSRVMNSFITVLARSCTDCHPTFRRLRTQLWKEHCGKLILSMGLERWLSC